MAIVNDALRKQPPARKAPPKRTVTPEVTRIVIAAKKILAQPQAAQQLVQMMKVAGDPANGVAQATIFLLKQLYEKSKGTLPPKAIVPAAQEIIVDVARLGAAAGLFKLSPELVKQAVLIAIQLFTQEAKAMQQQKAAPAQLAAPAPAAPLAAAAAPTVQPTGV